MSGGGKTRAHPSKGLGLSHNYFNLNLGQGYRRAVINTEITKFKKE